MGILGIGIRVENRGIGREGQVMGNGRYKMVGRYV